MSNTQNPLRLRKKHGSGKPLQVSAADGLRLIEAQSVRNAITVSLIVIVIFSVFLVSISSLTNRVFPWLTTLLGFALGHAIRLAGRGTDWRFPVIGAVAAIIGSLIANVSVGASVTAEGFGVGTLDVLRAVTSMTWPVFFDEVLTIADAIFALTAAALAAFYANRRLTRQQYHALRLWREEQLHD